MDLTLKCQLNWFFIKMHFDVSFIFSKFSTHYVHLFHNSMELCPLFLTLTTSLATSLLLFKAHNLHIKKHWDDFAFMFSMTFDEESLTFWVMNFSKTWQLQKSDLISAKSILFTSLWSGNEIWLFHNKICNFVKTHQTSFKQKNLQYISNKIHTV